MRVIFLGMTGNFSVPPLEQLITTGVDLCAVVTPAVSPAAEPLPRRLESPPPAPSDLPIINPHLEHNILHLAWAHNLPVWTVGSLSARQTLEWLAALQPDLIVVACFSLIFPPALLQLPRYGCLNLHPSPLPAYRGPAPLFWMARQGEPQAGVTLHFLDEGLDTGDIVAQRVFPWPEGISGTELERCCAVAGGQLVVAALQQLASEGALPQRPQPKAGSSYFSWPTEADFLIPTHWEARRAFNFLRGAEGWPLVIAVGAERFSIRVAIGYDPDQTLDQPYVFHNGKLWVQFQPGVLKVRL